MQICFISNSHINQFNLNKYKGPYNINRIYSSGASIKGLTNPDSKLQLNKAIDEYYNKNTQSILIYFLGQVDVEFGFFYKQWKEQRTFSIDEYIDDLIGHYETYLLKHLHYKFIILPINPNVITDIKHNYKVSFLENNGKNGYYSEETNLKFEDLKYLYNLSYEELCYHNKLFNKKLKCMCLKNNFKFIDFIPMLLDKDGNVKQHFKPKHIDHHLVCNDTSILEYILTKQINEDDDCNIKINYFNNKKIYKTIFNADENKRIINIYKFNNSFFSGNNLYYPNVLLISDNEHYLPVIEKTMSLNLGTLYEQNNMETKIKIPQGICGIGEKNRPINQIYKMTTTLEGNFFFFVYNTDNYFHFLYDSLPYLLSYFKLKTEIHDLKLLMQFPNPQKNSHYPFVIEMLELIGINDTDIEIINSTYEYENIFVSTSYTHDFDSNLPPRKEIYDFYQSISRKVLNIYKNPTPKKIYISRRTHLHNDFSNIGTNYTQRRKLVNEDQLVDKLINDGYVEVFTEKLSTIEKIAYFANASHIVGCIGGGIANVLFSKPTTKLTAIISPTFLEINKRFKYSLDCVDVFYDFNTSHIENSIYKTYMRIKHKSENIIGEIIEVKDNSVIVQYTDGSNTGWNSNNTYKTIELNYENIDKLDNGLNSSFSYTL